MSFSSMPGSSAVTRISLSFSDNSTRGQPRLRPMDGSEGMENPRNMSWNKRLISW